MTHSSTSIQKRAAQVADEPFLFQLYATSRDYEIHLTGWSDQQKSEFLQAQAELQLKHYRAYYPSARHELILLDGQPVGRLYVNRCDTEINLMDVCLLPDFRSRHIGAQLMQGLIRESKTAGLPIVCCVAKLNEGALRFYERFGFFTTSDDGVYLRLRRDPDAAPVE